MSTEVVTLGCRLNALESEVILRRAREAGLDDAIVVNTCAVTGEAERQARQAIRKLRRERPGAKLFVTGCAAQVAPEKFAAMPEVDRVLGNEEKLDVASYAGGGARVAVSDIMQASTLGDHALAGFETRTRAFVQIQQGCDHRCTFCIIPFGRGNSRSLEPAAVLRQVQRLVAAGYREIVFTGVDISSYAPMTLGALCRWVLAETPDLARLRLSSLDPAVEDRDLIALLADEPRLMPHLHLSIQAGSDMVLKRMKRRHLRSQAIAHAWKLRAARADLILGADLIAGFPTETEAMFDDTLAIVEEADLTYLHVFPYSARSGTPASKMPQVPGDVRRERAERLRAAGERKRQAYFASLEGQTAHILAERGNRGYTEHYAPVRLAKDAAPGTLVRARIRGIDGGLLIADAA